MIKKCSFYGGFLLGLIIGLMGLVLITNTASADPVSLSINPSLSDVKMPETFNIAITIAGLGSDPAALSLGAFDLSLQFDKDILSFQSCTFGDKLNFFGPTGPADPIVHDIWITGGDRGADSVPGSGTVTFWQFSLDSPAHLNSLQPSSFTLATLTFSAIGPGISPLSWDLAPSHMILTNAEAISIPDHAADFTATDAAASVTAVPVSSNLVSIVVLVMGIIGIAGMRAGRKDSSF